MRHFDLREEAREHLILTAHRGVAGGNIPCNTLAAFQAALTQKADMIELDVGCSRDGTLYIFHEGFEADHLKIEQKLGDMTDLQIRDVRYVNRDGVRTMYPILKMDEAFEFLKGQCYINIDKFRSYAAQIIQTVRRHDMVSQVVVKTPDIDMKLDVLEELAPDMPYIVMISEQDTVTEQIMRRNIHFVGVETVFSSGESPVAAESYRTWIHDKNLLLWGNAIVFDYRRVLSAGHTDDIAVTGDPDTGWGWFAKAGFDIIQTDWPLQARLYLQEKGLYFKTEDAVHDKKKV